MKHCPHRNTCSPERPCGPCSGGTLRDGERVAVPSMLMDGMQQAAHGAINGNRVPDDVREQARRDHEALMHAGPVNGSRQVLIDANRRYAESPSGRAYLEMAADLGRRG